MKEGINKENCKIKVVLFGEDKQGYFIIVLLLGWLFVQYIF